MATFGTKLKNAWNAFVNPKALEYRETGHHGGMFGYNPQTRRLSVHSERSIIASIYNRISIDLASIDIRHVRLDESGRYKEDIYSSLADCLLVEPNKDQGPQAFKQDAALTLFDKGAIAIVPVDTTINPLKTGGFDILSLRVGEIVSWYPDHVTVLLYNDRLGRKEEITLPKRLVAIVENPLYTVMNEPNSTLQRLLRKLSLLDTVDEELSSGKLDLIIQLPYVIKSEARRQQAEARRKDIEVQLKGSKYGIAYTDGTERITQLNRPAENNLLKQVEDLTAQLYNQLGLTEGVFNGTADEATMVNYFNTTVTPVINAITESMHRTFLTKTARSQGQAIRYFRDPFKLVAVSDIAEIADKFTRNEVLSSNEVRGIIGYKPVDDPKADELMNKNLARPAEQEFQKPEEGEIQNGT